MVSKHKYTFLYLTGAQFRLFENHDRTFIISVLSFLIYLSLRQWNVDNVYQFRYSIVKYFVLAFQTRSEQFEISEVERGIIEL